MAIVFVSPKERQKMFFWIIAAIFLLFMALISLSVFLAKPKTVSVDQVFKKPEINIDFETLNLQQSGASIILPQRQMEFNYSAQTQDNIVVTGSILASDQEEAKKFLEAKNYKNINIEKPQIGRDNPFTPYYGGVPIKTK